MYDLSRFQLFTVILFMAVIVSACQPAAPVAVDSPEDDEQTVEKIVQPAVKVADQELKNDSVTIAEIISNGPGWLVVHAQADGKPGPILGYAAVTDGTNKDLLIKINTDLATETMYAMLHVDAGTEGSFEFPDGPDIPVKVNDAVITPPFSVSVKEKSMKEMTPSVVVNDQEIKDNTVTITKVISDGPGWLVIHAQADGKPGPILGFAPVNDGKNKNIMIEIDTDQATDILYAMLHKDADVQGTFEFPQGDDGPVSVDGQVVTPSFAVIPSGSN